MQDFVDAAHAVLADLQRRIGLDSWWLCRRQDDEMTVLASLDRIFGRPAGATLRWADSYAARVLDGLAPQIAPRAAEVPAYAELSTPGGVAAGAVIVVPILSYDQTTLGIICAAGVEECDGLESALPTVTLAGQILGALLHQELQLSQQTRRAESAEARSYTDCLTQIGNRAAWDQALTAEEARAVRYASSASVVVLDLNGLKETNDSLGHEAGDQRLRRLAEVLSSEVRPCDTVARLGGDEFAVLLPETDAMGAGDFVARLRQRLDVAGLSAAIGTASRVRADGLAGAWQRADAAMYRDKRASKLVPATRTSPEVRPDPERRPRTDTTVDALLTLVRRQLHADAAFISSFSGATRRFRNVSSDIDLPFEVGAVTPRAGSYCQMIVAGELPEVVPDTSQSPVASLPVTGAVPVGSHVGIALHRADGRLYGTLCAFSQRPDLTLQDRDADVLRSVQTLLMGLVEAEDCADEARYQVLQEVERLLRGGGPEVVYQPVFDLATQRVVGHEALSRFPAGTASTAEWFRMAAASGVGPDLELAAVRNAALALPESDGYLALNVSPETACLPAFGRTMQALPLDRVVVEITEHAQVDDYAPLLVSLAPLRAAGLRVAVDDTGAGFASMRHVLALMPDYLKLDISLTRSIDSDNARQALAASLSAFAAATGASVIAEGIETVHELETLRALRIGQGQGFYLAEPEPVPAPTPA